MRIDSYVVGMVTGAKGFDNDKCRTDLFRQILDGRESSDPKLHSRAEEARDQLVFSLAPFVYGLCRKYCFDDEDMADAFNAGMERVVQLIDSFDPSRGVKITTYLDKRVRGAILAELNAARHPGMTRTEYEDHLKLQSAIQKLLSAHHESVCDEDLASETGFTMERIKLLRQADMVCHRESLDVCVGEGTRTLAETIADESVDPGGLLESFTRKELEGAIREVFTKCDRRILLVIMGRLPGKEAAEMMGVTGARVSQLKADALRRLREALEA